MRHSKKHQFRPGALEVFETRIVPTVTAYPGLGAYVPPGLMESGPLAGHDVSTSDRFDVSGDLTDDPDSDGGPTYPTYTGTTISATLTNNNPVAGSVSYVTLAVYAAEGQGFNFASQNLIYSATYKVVSGIDAKLGQGPITVSVDLSTLKIPGKEKVQCEIWSADDSNGYAPNKLKPGDTGYESHLILGELLEIEPDNGQKHK
jgi:hypothetical protein